MKATDREKAVIFALAAGYIDGWSKAYILSREYSTTQAEEIKSLRPTVTRWKQRDDIQKAYNFAIAALNNRDEATRQKALEEIKTSPEDEGQTTTPADSERTNNQKRSPVDYYDPKNQRTQINKIIAESQDDPKTQLDAIKAIQQTQRDDRQAAKDNQIQRFYTPVNCHFCPLYLKKRPK